MNTIRTRRRRPRVESISFRTFFWLLRCEAAWCVDTAWFQQHGGLQASRVSWVRTFNGYTVQWALRLIARYPMYGVQP